MVDCSLLNGLINIFNGKCICHFRFPDWNQRPFKTRKASCRGPYRSKTAVAF